MISLFKRWSNFRQVLSLNMKRTLSAGYWVVLLIGVGLFFIVCLINYFNESEDRMGATGVWVLVTIPALLMAIYLGMNAVLQECESRTLEVIFASSTSRYTIWLSRMGAVYLSTMSIVVLLCVLSFVFITDFPVFLYIVNVFFPLFFSNDAAVLLICARAHFLYCSCVIDVVG